MKIDQYLKYLKFKTKAKYLTRDFIVPKFDGTEPDRTPEEIEQHIKNQRGKNDRTI